ncbi:MAG: winged helix-turn-helix transcriptional regulator [Phycisphaerales bacterium]|nr:MAG: winged helix-turn-helix transcriptional regulator [Phycisphaerales bacterium]
MDRKKQTRFEARAKIIKAMAHPTRLFIVDELSRRELCVYKITEKVGADVSTISRHLSVLKNAGIVEAERRGSRMYYNLCMPCVLDFFSCVESVIKCQAKARQKLAR